MDIILIWIWAGVLLIILTLYIRKKYSWFIDNHVNHLPPAPLLGNMWRSTCFIESMADMLERLYTSFPNDRFVGHYEFMTPMVMIRDLDMIKDITVKDFDCFLNHPVFVSEDIDFVGKALFFLKDQKWKDMRATLSPAFTSSKIRLMVPFMIEVGDQMIASLKNKLDDLKSEIMDIEIKDLATRYANDVIATCAFGLKVDSMADENNEFYQVGKSISTLSFTQMLKSLCFLAMPRIMNKLNITLSSKKLISYVFNLIKDAMKVREKQNIIRPDMIHLLMEAKKGNLKHDQKNTSDSDAGFATVEESSLGKSVSNRVWTDEDLVAQAILFFIAGFDSVATVMTFVLMELALNPECQDKLVEEIRETDSKSGGFDYNSVQQMKYLDMVVSETMRKWPPSSFTDRIASKSYNLGHANGKSTKDYIIKEGEGVYIPTVAIHKDPKYYKNPEKFDPERFSDENKHKINPFTYIPFGIGPRNCIASRFALCEVKVMLYQLLQYMEVSPSKKTKVPLKLNKKSINLKLEGGHWLTIRARKTSQ